MSEYAGFLAQLDEYEADLSAEYPLSSHIPTPDHLRSVAKRVEHEITKLAIILKEDKAQEMHFETLEKVMSTLFAIYTNLVGYAGTTLKRKLRASFGVIFSSVKNVVLKFKFIEEGKPHESDKDNDKPKNDDKKEFEVKVYNPTEALEQGGRLPTTQLVGIVWEHARTLGQMSISNHIAIAQEMRGIAQLCQDAHEEVQAMVSVGEDEGDGDLEEEFDLTPEQRARLGPISQFAKANFTLLDRVATKLEETAASSIEGEVGAIEKLEEALRLADQLSKYTDEICSYMYTPEDVESLITSTKELRRQADLFLDVVVTLDSEMPKLSAKKLEGVVRTLVGNLTTKICGTENIKP